MHLHWQDHITTDPKIMFGKPVIRGTCIPIELILEKLGNGDTTAQLLEAYPRITAKDISACLFFAQQSVKNDLTYSLASA